jgi:hypothetical protein
MTSDRHFLCAAPHNPTLRVKARAFPNSGALAKIGLLGRDARRSGDEQVHPHPEANTNQVKAHSADGIFDLSLLLFSRTGVRAGPLLNPARITSNSLCAPG